MKKTLNRREMLQRMGMGMGMLGLAETLRPSLQADEWGRLAAAHRMPRAKRVIFLFLNGGPSHVDTFDPKPALEKYAGQQPDGSLYKKSNGSGYLPSPYQFKRWGQSGIEVSESLPQLAQVIDETCIIRSMHTDVPNHEPALLQMCTGNIQPIRPSMGSWISYGLGTENENLPAYVVLRPSPKIVVGPALWSNSFLPAAHQATSVITSDMAVEKLITHIRHPFLNREVQAEQLNLVQGLNRLHLEERQRDSELEGQIRALETAFSMQSEALEAFDVSKEPAWIRESYGETRFGQSCLLARRLAERGVRFTTIYYTSDGSNQPWDTHKNHHKQHPKLCADADRGAAALIRDLKSRGLLEDTLVVFSGEFGRTPYAETKDDRDTVGRDHHHTGFSLMLAGGGVRGGMVYGATDELGMRAEDRPVHVHDLHATILHLLGLNHEKLTYRYSGRDFRLTDVHGSVVEDILA